MLIMLAGGWHFASVCKNKIPYSRSYTLFTNGVMLKLKKIGQFINMHVFSLVNANQQIDHHVTAHCVEMYAISGNMTSMHVCICVCPCVSHPH